MTKLTVEAAVSAAARERSRSKGPTALAGAVLRRALATAGSRVALASVVVLALGWLATGPFTAAGHARETPFRVDYIAFDTAASIVRQGDAARLYDRDLQRSVQASRTGNGNEPHYFVFANPPVVAVLFVPLTLLPARAAYVGDVLLLSAMMMTVALLIFRLLGDAPRVTRLFATICVLGSTATASALLSGQLTPLLLLAGLGSLLLHQRGRPVAAGMILGVLFIKPHIGLAALLVLFLLGQRRIVVSAISTMSLIVLGSWLMAGNAGMEGYVRLLRIAFVDPANLDMDVRTEQNLRGLLASVFHVYNGPYISPLSSAVALVALVAVVVAARRTTYTGPDRAHYVAALAAMFVCVAAPHIQYYDLALVVFPALFLVRRASQVPPQGRPHVLGVIVLMVAWLEVAGLLAGAKASVSFVPLIVLAAGIVEWPQVERWLVRTPASSPATPERSTTEMAA
jgi:hypothetical protein